MSRLPWIVVRTAGKAIGLLAWHGAVKERTRALENIRRAMPDLGEEERRNVIRAMFVHLGLSAAEMLHAERFHEGPEAIDFGDDARGLFREALDEGRGVVFVSGHLGNWELFAHVLGRSGIPMSTIASPLYDPRLTRWVGAERSRYGLDIIWRGEKTATREMINVFRQGRCLALLIDQDTRVKGAFVPFFGCPAHTPTAAARLALHRDLPVLLGWMHRKGSRHEVHMERVSFHRSGRDREAEVIALTELLTRRLQSGIETAPEQWVWLHPRWKNSERKNLSECRQLELLEIKEDNGNVMSASWLIAIGGRSLRRPWAGDQRAALSTFAAMRWTWLYSPSK